MGSAKNAGHDLAYIKLSLKITVAKLGGKQL